MFAVRQPLATPADLAVGGRADVGRRYEAEGGDGDEKSRGELHHRWTVGGGGVVFEWYSVGVWTVKMWEVMFDAGLVCGRMERLISSKIDHC
jgi:hypothetical protein